jgi:phospholipid N-methyltransferase
MPWFSDARTFLGEYRSNFKHTGAVLPSGNALGRALTRFVREGTVASSATMPRRLLEVGPGTGAVTRHICTHLAPTDRLDLCELNATFVDVLHRRLREEKPFNAAAPNVQIHHCPVEQLPSGTQYDVIISGLPLNNFEAAEVEHILQLFAGLLKPGGTLSFFQYIGIRKLRAVTSSATDRVRLRGIARAMDGLLERGEFQRDHVWVNVPPAYVHHVRLGS